jgi:hypothetical protein
LRIDFSRCVTRYTARQVSELAPVSMCGERRDAKAMAMRLDDVERNR